MDFDDNDSRKQFNGIKGLPEIFTLAGTTKAAINAQPLLTGDRTIDLGMRASEGGRYVLRATDMINLPISVRLCDRLTGQAVNLSTGEEMSVDLDQAMTDEMRFQLIFGTATGLTDLEALSFEAFALQGGIIEIHVEPYSIVSAYRVYNGLGQMMFNELQDASVFRMKNVFESGLYVVERVI